MNQTKNVKNQAKIVSLIYNFQRFDTSKRIKTKIIILNFSPRIIENGNSKKEEEKKTWGFSGEGGEEGVEVVLLERAA